MKLNSDIFTDAVEPLLLIIKHLLASESIHIWRTTSFWAFNLKREKKMVYVYRKSDATFSCWNAAISCTSCLHLIWSTIQTSAPLRRRPLRCKEVLCKVLHKYTLNLGDTFQMCGFLRLSRNRTRRGAGTVLEIKPSLNRKDTGHMSTHSNSARFNLTADCNFLGVGWWQVNDIWHLY